MRKVGKDFVCVRSIKEARSKDGGEEDTEVVQGAPGARAGQLGPRAGLRQKF